MPRGQNFNDAPSLCFTRPLRKAYSCSVKVPQSSHYKRNERSRPASWVAPPLTSARGWAAPHPLKRKHEFPSKIDGARRRVRLLHQLLSHHRSAHRSQDRGDLHYFVGFVGNPKSLFVRASVRGGNLHAKRIERTRRHRDLFLSGNGKLKQLHFLRLHIEVAKCRAVTLCKRQAGDDLPRAGSIRKQRSTQINRYRPVLSVHAHLT